MWSTIQLSILWKLLQVKLQKNRPHVFSWKHQIHLHIIKVVIIKNLKLLCQIHYFIINSPIFIEYLGGLWMIFYGFVLVWKTTTLDQRHNPKKLATIFRVSKQNRGKLWTIRPYIILVILMQQNIIFEFWVETPRFFKMLKTLIISDR